MNNFDWNDEAITRLRTLWNEGHATAEIGRRMGITKNAVVGKAHRLDLPERPSPILRNGPAKSGKPPGLTPRTPRTKGPTLPMIGESKPAGASATAATTPQPPTAPLRTVAATLAAPVRRVSGEPCCWPIGEPGTRGFRYCDAATERGRPYCPEHADLSTVKGKERRSRADGASLDRYLGRLTATP